MTNQTARVLALLKRFNQNKKVCIDGLKNDYLWEGKSDKTIRRDLDVLKEIFPESFELVRGGEPGCYKAITREVFDNFLHPNTLSLLIQMFSVAQHSELFGNLEIEESDRRIIESKLKDTKKIYTFKGKPFENRSGDPAIFKRLEHCIYHRKKMQIDYTVRGKTRTIMAHPYKILFTHENFYVACEVIGEPYRFSLFRISRIAAVHYDKETFHRHPDIESFIAQMQTPFARYQPNYQEHLVSVILEVDRSRAEYFTAKKHLDSQKILEHKPDGTLILEYRVTHAGELSELVKRWLPHIRILSPETFREQIAADLRQYLATMESDHQKTQ